MPSPMLSPVSFSQCKAPCFGWFPSHCWAPSYHKPSTLWTRPSCVEPRLARYSDPTYLLVCTVHHFWYVIVFGSNSIITGFAKGFFSIAVFWISLLVWKCYEIYIRMSEKINISALCNNSLSYFRFLLFPFFPQYCYMLPFCFPYDKFHCWI